jgi:hypothetical protein
MEVCCSLTFAIGTGALSVAVALVGGLAALIAIAAIALAAGMLHSGRRRAADCCDDEAPVPTAERADRTADVTDAR